MDTDEFLLEMGVACTWEGFSYTCFFGKSIPDILWVEGQHQMVYVGCDLSPYVRETNEMKS